MREMDILQKEDLPYFEELEQAGKAVILRFDSMEDLMNYDLDALLKSDGTEPSFEEIQAWMTEQRVTLQKQSSIAETSKEHIVSMEQQLELLQQLQECALPVEDKELIGEAIKDRLPYETIMELLRPELTHEQRQIAIQKSKFR